MATQSDYELARAKNIAENQALLASLNIETARAAAIPIKSSNGIDKPKSTTARKRKAPSTTTSILPARKSARLEGSSARTYNENELEQAEAVLSRPSTAAAVSVVQLKQLPSVRLPDLGEDEEDYDPDYRAPLPTRDGEGEGAVLHFEAEKAHFTPNMTPEEMLRAGCFGGTAFRPFYSRVVKQHFEPDYDEFPAEWVEGLDVEDKLTRTVYEASVNRYGVKAGQSLEEWEQAGWMAAQDPRGFLQWYARFYMGRRTRDDERQIRRWLGVCGPTGRFKRSLVKKIAQKGAAYDDYSVSPILRQTLLHWGYHLTEADYQLYL